MNVLFIFDMVRCIVKRIAGMLKNIEMGRYRCFERWT